ncbi:MAG: sigma 54-interacting transcriptional regulator [Bacillota bacterium]|nr:sigma 54-interacting transcriptional regulator [Bacillota bacterium]
MHVRIGCLLCGEITQIYKKLEPTLPPDVELVYYHGVFEEIIKHVRALERANAVDVFLTAGSSAQLTMANTTLPVVEMLPSGFDFLLAVNQAVKTGNCSGIGVITYQKPLPVLHSVAGVLPVPVVEKTFRNADDLEQTLDFFWQMGIRDIIGGFLACDLARRRGMRGHNLTSEDSIKNGLDRAIDIARARKREIKKAQQWQTILEFAHEGIVATDEKGIITLFNRSAEKITGVKHEKALGQSASKLLTNSRLEQVIKTKRPELNQIQVLDDVKILTNRVPIIVNDEAVGSVATFQTIGEIQRAEQKIRRKLYDTGFVALYRFEDMVGESEALLLVKKKALHYARSSASILIQGETGTGKEVFAQSIHNASDRRKKPFVSVNCAALPPSLLESELFGYEEGAFTGAKRGGKYGLFELAHEGTIFLDEIAEIPPEIQARLLRVLEEKQVLRIGGEKIINIDIRVITATNKNLLEMVEAGSFREDLYYRINVLSLDLPPLRERKEDIRPLFEGFFLGFRQDLTPGELHKLSCHPALKRYPWPGNIRQLRNFAERLAILYHKGADVNLLLREAGLSPEDNEDWENNERQLIENTLEHFHGNKTKAAAYLGMSRTTLWRKLSEKKD